METDPTLTEDPSHPGLSSPATQWPVAFDRDYPHSEAIELYIHERSLRNMLGHVWDYRDVNLEVMGFMIGELFTHEGQEYTVVRDIVTGDLDASSVSVKFTEEAFAQLFAQLDGLDYEYILAGWYHSHPGHTCFLSATDVETQRTMFKKPYQTAVVIDPLNIEMKAYTHSDVGYREKSFAIYREKRGKKIVKRKVVRRTKGSRAIRRKRLKVVG